MHDKIKALIKNRNVQASFAIGFLVGTVLVISLT